MYTFKHTTCYSVPFVVLFIPRLSSDISQYSYSLSTIHYTHPSSCLDLIQALQFSPTLPFFPYLSSTQSSFFINYIPPITPYLSFIHFCNLYSFCFFPYLLQFSFYTPQLLSLFTSPQSCLLPLLKYD